jgi:hypothetical protein
MKDMKVAVNSLKIYVAGPYTALTEYAVRRNVEYAMDVGIELLRRGHSPFVPHLTHFLALRAKGRGYVPTWKDYMLSDLNWLRDADALFLIGHSRGADIELAEARFYCLDIFTSLNEVSDVTDNSSNPFG